MNKIYESLKERYDPLPLANWQQDGFPFDYNSVMLSTFYDNNLKSLDALVQNYNPAEYSILRNSDNSRNVYESMHTIYPRVFRLEIISLLRIQSLVFPCNLPLVLR